MPTNCSSSLAKPAKTQMSKRYLSQRVHCDSSFPWAMIATSQGYPQILQKAAARSFRAGRTGNPTGCATGGSPASVGVRDGDGRGIAYGPVGLLPSPVPAVMPAPPLSRTGGRAASGTPLPRNSSLPARTTAEHRKSTAQPRATPSFLAAQQRLSTAQRRLCGPQQRLRDRKQRRGAAEQWREAATLSLHRASSSLRLRAAASVKMFGLCGLSRGSSGAPRRCGCGGFYPRPIHAGGWHDLMLGGNWHHRTPKTVPLPNAPAPPRSAPAHRGVG